jgi:hypothetical protein
MNCMIIPAIALADLSIQTFIKNDLAERFQIRPITESTLRIKNGDNLK